MADPTPDPGPDDPPSTRWWAVDTRARTLPDAARQAETHGVGTDALASTTEDGAAPVDFAAATVADTQPQQGEDAIRDRGRRYTLGPLLGTGATSQVFAAVDHVVGREVAMKVLAPELAHDRDGRARFAREARLAARLEHPGIVPVYDLVDEGDGRTYFTMRKVSGTTLGEAIAQAAQGPAPVRISSPARIAELVRRVAESLDRAHSQGVLHRDVKPDNIVLGDYGEVMLVDWGSALKLDTPGAGAERLVGTPAYMSPEQARRGAVDRRSDVYCLGATAFHALLGRYPLQVQDPEAFWERKRRGEIDPPGPGERRRLPRALLAIVLKALAADPGQRYGSMRELSDDLGRFLAGEAVAALPEGLPRRLLRLVTRHPRSFAASALLLVALAGTAAYARSLLDLQTASWGDPVLEEDFSGDGWQRDFRPLVKGTVVVKDGVAETRGTADSSLLCTRQWHGAVAVEYSAMMNPEAPVGDLSFAWFEQDPVARMQTDPDIRRSPLYGQAAILVQIGAFDNTMAMISLTRGATSPLVSAQRLAIAPGRWHRVRVELDGYRIRLQVDGRTLLERTELLPVQPGWFAIFGYYPRKAFDQVRVQVRSLPALVPPTAFGDRLLALNRPEEAATTFAEVERSHPGTDLAQEAAYKRGVALALLDRRSEAESAWRTLSPGLWSDLAGAERFAALGRGGQEAEALTLLRRLWEGAGVQARERLALLWAQAVLAQSHDRPAPGAAWLDLHQELFPDDYTARRSAAEWLYRRNRFQNVLQRYPDVDRSADLSRLNLGHFSELASSRTGSRNIRAKAMLQLGLLDEVVRTMPDNPGEIEYALGLQGRWQDLIELHHTRYGGRINPLWPLLAGQSGPQPDADVRDRNHRGMMVLRALRTPEELLPLVPDQPDSQWVRVLLDAGRGEEALALTRYREDTELVHWWNRVDALARGDAAAADRQAAVLAHSGRIGLATFTLWPEIELLPALLLHAAGDRAAAHRALSTIAEPSRPYGALLPQHTAAYLLAREDRETFLAQPARDVALQILPLAEAMRLDLAGDPACAAAYRTWLDQPITRRLVNGLDNDPVLERWARWRAEAGGKR